METTRCWSRRDFLAALAGALALPQVACSTETGLSESDLLIASLGRQLAVQDAGAAALLASWVEEQMAARYAHASAGERARIARRQLLTRSRLTAEFDAGDVILVDGWTLARSEAAVAAYLDSLAREGPAGG